MAVPSKSQCSAVGPCETAWLLQSFENDDACGDWVLPFGRGAFQSANALTAGCFVASGAHVLLRADAPIARAYGFMMCLVGVASFSFHATSTLVGFMVDIVPMAVTAGMMLFRAVHALQVESGVSRGAQPETQRLVIALGAPFVAVYLPWAMMQAGLPHSVVWGLWAFLFGAMGVAFAVVALLVFACEGALGGGSGRNITISVAAILLGLGCTTHSFIPGLCDGWRTQVPLHAFWHFFSAITANRMGHLLSDLTLLVESLESREGTPGGKSSRPLLLRMLRDALPSQFSM